MPDWLVMRAARRPDEPAIRARSAAWSRAQLLEAADALATALVAEGVKPGDRIASVLADDAPAVVLIHAARRLGAVLVPLNRRAAAAELSDQLKTARAGILVHDGADGELAAEAAGATVERHRIEALLAGAPCAVPPPLRAEVDLDAPAVIIFTSGTTGRPKGAVLTHGNLAASAHAWANVLGPRATDRWLACLPLFHVAGLAIVTRAARWGVELQVADHFDAVEVAAALEDGISHVSLVPAQLEQLLAARDGRPVPTTLRAILLGGGPISMTLLARARDAGYRVLTTYGMTETASGIAVGGADAATLADPTAGRALPLTEIRIAPDDIPVDIPADAPDGSGTILVRGPTVFAGYVDDPTATAEVLRDGWLHTGDIGTIDSAGLLRVADRRDDLIISGGENVYPAEVEAALVAHPDVAEAAVVGLPDARWGAVPVAAVVMGSTATATDDELARHCRERLAGFKVPVRFHRLDALPRNGLGKVRRHDLRDAFGGEAR